MSSTRGNVDPTELYTTPAWAVDAVLPHLPLSGVIVDAGCGEGAILKRVAESVVHRTIFRGVELNMERAQRARERLDRFRTFNIRIDVGDWLSWDSTVDLAIFNPPFGPSLEFIAHAIELTAPRHGTVAALLRSNWSVPTCMAEFGQKHPFDLGHLRRRPAFAASVKCRSKACGWRIVQPIDSARPKVCPTCGGKVHTVTTDSADYGWHIWGPGRGGRFFYLDTPRGRVKASAEEVSPC